MNQKVYYQMKNIGKRTLKIPIKKTIIYKNIKKKIHDVTVRSILMHKKEAVIFINNTLNLNGTENELTVNNIELYNNRFVTKSFYNKETDIIYKMKNKDVFFLIEHQSTIDYEMPRRIVEYKIEIIRQYIKNSKQKGKEYKIPLIKAIVIYTGKEKWNVAKTIEETQEKLEGDKNNSFGSYIPVDMNNFSEEEKLNTKGILFKIITLDMAKSKEKIEEIYKKIEEKALTKEEKEIIRDYTINIMAKVFNTEEIEEIIQKCKLKGEEDMSSQLAETLKQEMARDREEALKQGVKQGVKQGKIIGLKSVAKEMLKAKMDRKIIIQWTKLSEKEIKELEKQVNRRLIDK